LADAVFYFTTIYQLFVCYLSEKRFAEPMFGFISAFDTQNCDLNISF